MEEFDVDIGEPLAEVACGGFGGIDGAMLPAGAAKSDLQMGETALQETRHMVVNQAINAL